MTDEHPEPGNDPLAGWDPHPREQIDLWPLHDARQELLEEIVSQPGTGSTAGRTKILLSVVGAAAVLALVIGGTWAVTGTGADDGREREEVVAAASDDPTSADPTTEATADPTKEPRRRNRDVVRVRGVEVGRVRMVGNCDRKPLRSRDITIDRLQEALRRGARQGSQDVYVVERTKGCRLVFRALRVRPGER